MLAFFAGGVRAATRGVTRGLRGFGEPCWRWCSPQPCSPYRWDRFSGHGSRLPHPGAPKFQRGCSPSLRNIYPSFWICATWHPQPRLGKAPCRWRSRFQHRRFPLPRRQRILPGWIVRAHFQKPVTVRILPPWWSRVRSARKSRSSRPTRRCRSNLVRENQAMKQILISGRAAGIPGIVSRGRGICTEKPFALQLGPE